MKKILFTAAFALAAGYGFSQAEEGENDENVNEDQQEQQDPQENETPDQSAHGKAISELAQSTPAGPDKGHIISSAAREKALLHANSNAAFMENEHAGGTNNAENAGSDAAEAASTNASETGTTASGIGTSLKPAEAGMPETPGKPAMLPPVTNTTKGKPDGLPGGGH